MKKILVLLFIFSYFHIFISDALAQVDVTPIYRHSFTARYEGLAGGEPIREVAYSADSTRVGYVRDNNLWIKDLASGREWAVTNDGRRNHIINGATDWVYEEEYGFTRAWTFSPDGGEVAWLRFDESAVPEYSLLKYGTEGSPTVYTYKYPRAGEANSEVSLWVHDFVSGKTREIFSTCSASRVAPEGGGGDKKVSRSQLSTLNSQLSTHYLPHLGYTPTGELYFYRVNRLQNVFEVVSGGRVVYRESSPAYVERPDAATVTFRQDGRHFVVRNETRTGWWVEDLWSVDDGFVGQLNSLEPAEIGSVDLSLWNGRDEREFFEFTNDGVVLYGWLMRPADFDPAKRYPVLMTQYSGPGSQSVFVESISRGDMAIYGPLLEAGYVVACVDPRGTGGRGEAFKKCTYGRLGELETLDQIAAARYLGGLPFVDPARIGIYGWSYGGFVALNAVLKGADVFAAAVAVAPVTSWRFYDTIYTETYNGLPLDNAGGYDDNSPVNYAHLLRGRLLLVHGSGDDNVHPDNTFAMARALVAADREFEMMIYPDADHSMRPGGEHHVRRLIVRFILDNL